MLRNKGIILGIGLVMLSVSCAKKVDVSKLADKNCICCIEDKIKENRFIAAYLGSSKKAKTIRLKVNANTELVVFDDKTKVVGAESLGAIKKQTCLIVDFQKKGSDLYATSVEALPPLIERVKEYVVQTKYMQEKIKNIPPDTTNFTLIDSRPRAPYLEGTIPGAINIPYPKLKGAKDKVALLGKDKNRELIFFCGGEHCNLAPGSAIEAKNAGYKNIKVYHEGFPTWRDQGNPICMQMDGFLSFVKKGVSMIVVDLRPANDAKASHIPGAINIQPKDIGQWQARFPKIVNPYIKMAPIVFYLDSNKCDKGGKQNFDVAPVLKTVFSWGYRNVSILNGGFEKYKASQAKVESNKLATKITYVRKLLPGQIADKDFVDKYGKLTAADVIVDARPADEFSAAHIPGAINIPATDITPATVEQLKNYTNVYFYCNSGILAEIAYDKISKLGFNKAKFLKTTIVHHEDKVEIGQYEKFFITKKKAGK